MLENFGLVFVDILVKSPGGLKQTTDNIKAQITKKWTRQGLYN